MKEIDKKRFSLLMRRLRVIFPTSLNDKDEALRAEVYWQEFKNITIDEFECAVNESIKSLSFFPKPAELHEFSKQNIELKYNQNRIEYKEQPVTPERANEILSKIQKMIDLKSNENLKPSLDGEKAKKFEEKREKLKEQAKKLGVK